MAAIGLRFIQNVKYTYPHYMGESLVEAFGLSLEVLSIIRLILFNAQSFKCTDMNIDEILLFQILGLTV